MPPMKDFALDMRRADEHLNTFDEKVAEYIRSHDKPFKSKLVPKGQGEYDLIVTASLHAPVPDDISFLAAEALMCLRLALDHLVHELSLERAGSAHDLTTTEFPIYKSRKRFNARDSRGMRRRGSGWYKIRFVQPAAQAIIKNLQPYIAPQDVATMHPLWVLNELVNIYKHRRLHLISFPIGLITLLADASGPPPFEVISREIFARRPLEDGAILVKFHLRELSGSGGEVNVNYQVPRQVMFDEAVTIPIPDRYAVEIMQDIRIFIEREVLRPLTPFIQ